MKLSEKNLAPIDARRATDHRSRYIPEACDVSQNHQYGSICLQDFREAPIQGLSRPLSAITQEQPPYYLFRAGRLVFILQLCATLAVCIVMYAVSFKLNKTMCENV